MRTLTTIAATLLLACTDKEEPTPTGDTGVTPAPTPTFEVLSPDTTLAGMTLSEAGADWWRWFWETPASVNPLFDNTGAHCSEGQSGELFYLAGSFGTLVERTCTVTHDGPFLIPIVNWYYDACSFLPADQLPEDQWGPTIDAFLDSVEIASLTIDGETIGSTMADFDEYRTEVTPFTYESPATDSALTYFGYEYVASCDAVAAGFYVPFTLTKGDHEIRVTAAPTLDVTYHLTVE